MIAGIHIITFGTLVFQFLLVGIQGVMFRQREFSAYALYCFLLSLYVFLFHEEIFGVDDFFAGNTGLDFFVKRQLGFVGFLLYTSFARRFLDMKNKQPKILPYAKLLEKMLVFNIAWHTVAFFMVEIPLRDIFFTIGFVIVAVFAVALSVWVLRERDIFGKFIAIASMSMAIGCIMFIIYEDVPSGQVFFDLGLWGQLVCLNIGLIYKFNFLQKQQIENQELIIKNLSEKEKLANDLLSIRERISMDIHDDVLGGLSTIRIFSDLIKTTAPQNTEPFAKRISATTHDLTVGLNAIIWSLNSANDELGSFAAYTKDFGYAFFENTGITFSFEDKIQGCESYLLSGIHRKNLFLIIKEAFHNTLKHAQASHVLLNLSLLGNQLHIAIQDDGIGIQSKRKFGNGLNNMQKRMEEIGGEINFESGNGTTIQLVFPIEREGI